MKCGGMARRFTGEVAPTPEQMAALFVPAAKPRSQSTRVVLSRLTDAEYTALTTCPVVGIQRAVDTARAEGVISEADPLFVPFKSGAAALGLIAENRWDALLAV